MRGLEFDVKCTTCVMSSRGGSTCPSWAAATQALS